MSKFMKFLAVAALIMGAFAMTPSPAAARWHGGHWHGGGWGWGPGPFWGWGGYPYPYYGGYYAGPPGCGYVRIWRRHRWVLVPRRCYY